MSKKQILALSIPPLIILFLLVIVFFGANGIALLDPKGYIASKEVELIRIALFLGLSVVVPVIILIFFIAYKYREGNTNTKYSPDKTNSFRGSLLLWVIPSAVVLILAVITWKQTHLLDPYKPLSSNSKPITIEVVALRWKWLFIYPKQNIATVNFVEFPVNTPVNFELTADAPMNSFWIPQLSGQIYAMTGMVTNLHISANTVGDYSGSAAEINGRGFSGMRFTARASSEDDFNSWVSSVKNSKNYLNLSTYNSLSSPSENYPVTFYSSTDENLYNEITNKFLMPPIGPVNQN